MTVHTNNKTAFLSFFVILFVFSSLSLFAQEKDKNDLEKKLSELKGKVEKITVNVGGKDVVFEGKDAQMLAKKMRTSSGEYYTYSYGKGTEKGKGKSLTYTITDKDLADIKEGEIEDEDIYVTVAGEEGLEKDMKKIKVEKKDGQTKLTITTRDKDGKEVENVLEGADAEKYLEENEDGVTARISGINLSHSSKPVKIKIIKGRPAKHIIIEKDAAGDDDEETTVVIEKADKTTKDAIIKKKKAETDKKEIE